MDDHLGREVEHDMRNPRHTSSLRIKSHSRDRERGAVAIAVGLQPTVVPPSDDEMQAYGDRRMPRNMTNNTSSKLLGMQR